MNASYCFLIILTAFLRWGRSELYPSIQWTPTNTLFSQNQTQCVYPMSKVIFVCPNPAMVVGIQQDGTAKERMYENLWLVDKQSYDQCKVNTTHPKTKLLLKCEFPLQLKYRTVVFQKYSAHVGGPEYKPGEEYYFIATSDGTKPSLTDLSAGHCRTKNMRLEFHVCHNETDARCENPDKCNYIRKDPTKESPTTPQKSDTAHTTTAAVITTSTPTKKAGNNTKQDVPRHPDISGSSTTKYIVTIGILTFLTVALLLATFYQFYQLRLQKQARTTKDHCLTEKLHSPTL